MGQRQLIEPLGHTKSILETSIIPQILLKQAGMSEQSFLPEVSVNVPKGANLVEVSIEAPESKGEQVLATLTEIAGKVSEDHRLKSGDIQEILQQKVEMMAVKVQALSAKLVEGQRNREVIALKLERLQDKRDLLRAQIERINSEVAELQKTRSLYLNHSAKSKDALALLLIDNEINQSARLRDELEHALLIELPEEQSELTNLLDSKAAQLEIATVKLDRAKEIYGRYSRSAQGSGESNVALEESKNIYPTNLAVNPYRSVEPLGIGRSVKLVNVFLFASFIALMMTFIAEFISRVRGANVSHDHPVS